MASGQRNAEFAALMAEIAAGRSDRELGRLAGISPTYIGNMKWGDVPSYRYLEKFTDNLGLDAATARRLFQAAEYAPRSDSTAEEPPEGETGAVILAEGLAALGVLSLEAYAGILPYLERARELSPDEARAVLAELQRQRAEGLI